MSSPFGVHKDRDPSATIRRIRAILSKLGIVPDEETYRFTKDCYSVRLWDPAFPVGTNGKGVSRELARASAYAEFMERLQTGILYGTEFGLMQEGQDLFPDACQLSSKDAFAEPRAILRRHTRSAKRWVRSPISKTNEKVQCVPFWRISDGAVVPLPRNWLHYTATSNGMCAGNTMEEALVQGLCEIFERYALRRVFTGKAKAPTIPRSSLRSLGSYQLIRQMEEQGGYVLVKDCTLGGKLPVVGVVVFDRQRRKYKVALGSDPVLDVAVHRCLTELVQGCNPQDLDARMLDLDEVLLEEGSTSTRRDTVLQLEKAFVDGTGAWSQSFFQANGKPQHQHAFTTNHRGHGEMLTHLIGLARSLSFDIYIRDVSYLGFPTYHVFIPGMSERSFGSPQDQLHHHAMRARLKEFLLRLPTLSKAQIRQGIEWIEILNSQLVWATYERLAGIQVRSGTSLYEADLSYLLVFLYLRVGDYAAAYRSLHRYLRSPEVEEFGGYKMCVLFVLKSKAAGMSHHDIENDLSDLFGKKLVREVINDVGNPTKSFQYLQLPVCSNCATCPAKPDCLYPRWKKVFLKMREHYARNPLDQSHLAVRMAEYIPS